MCQRFLPKATPLFFGKNTDQKSVVFIGQRGTAEFGLVDDLERTDVDRITLQLGQGHAFDAVCADRDDPGRQPWCN
jgi:hypothetical protein